MLLRIVAVREIAVKTERKTQLVDITRPVREALDEGPKARPCSSTCRTRRPA